MQQCKDLLAAIQENTVRPVDLSHVEEGVRDAGARVNELDVFLRGAAQDNNMQLKKEAADLAGVVQQLDAGVKQALSSCLADQNVSVTVASDVEKMLLKLGSLDTTTRQFMSNCEADLGRLAKAVSSSHEDQQDIGKMLVNQIVKFDSLDATTRQAISKHDADLDVLAKSVSSFHEELTTNRLCLLSDDHAARLQESPPALCKVEDQRALYRVGDQLETCYPACDRFGKWVPCVIEGVGSKPQCFHLSIPGAPIEASHVKDVHVRYLQRSDPPLRNHRTSKQQRAARPPR